MEHYTTRLRIAMFFWVVLAIIALGCSVFHLGRAVIALAGKIESRLEAQQ